MKNILLALTALVSSVAFGATLVPVQLLNPTGSASGQAIVSTGASSAPAWSNVTAAGLVAQAANTVVANVTAASASPTAFPMPSCSATGSALNYTSGTGFTCASGYLSAAGGTFTGTVGLSYVNPVFTINDSTGAGLASILLKNSGSTAWNLYNASSSSNQFALGRYVSGSFVDNPITVSNSTGLVTLGGGLNTSSLTATSTVTVPAGTTFTTPNITGVTTGTAPAAGSVGEYPTPATGSAVPLTTATPANCTSKSLTAGDYLVFGSIMFNGAGTTATTVYQAGINTSSATLPGAPYTGEFYIGTSGTNTSVSIAVPMQQVLVSATTTVYLVAQAAFATSTETATCVLQALRIH